MTTRETESCAEIRLDEKYQVLPSMAPEQFESLKADIAERGVIVPIDVTEDGYILDGHHRYRACQELGIVDFPTIIRPNLDEQDRRLFARNNNMLRRHLSRAQIRELIKQQLKDTPQWSNSRIANSLGVDKKTVQTQRNKLEATGEIPQLTDLVGSDNKRRKAKKPAAIMAANAQELFATLNKLSQVEGDISGFLSSHGLSTMVFKDEDYDVFANLTEEEEKQWLIEMVEGLNPRHFEWIRQRNFKSPLEYFSEEGQRWRRGVGMPVRKTSEEENNACKKRLEQYQGWTLDRLRKAVVAKYPAEF